MVDAVRSRVPPAHTGVLLPAVGAAGRALIVTVGVVPAGPVQPFAIAVTEYMPLAAVVTLLIDGFC